MTISKTSNLWSGLLITMFIVFLASLLLNGSTQGEQEATASNVEAKFSPDFFPINPWGSHFRAGLPPMAECNFTTAGFFVTTEDIPYCKEVGLKAILWSGLPRNYGALAKMSDVEIEAQVKKAVWETRNDPRVFGYFIIDEPGAIAFHALGVAVKAVKKYAPGKLAYINLFPSHARTSGQAKASGHSEQLWTKSYTEYLERYVKEVKPQMISYDNYEMFSSSPPFPGYFKNLMEVRRVALKYDLPFWNFCASSNWGPLTVPSPANLSLQVYTSLAAGARGISWYRYYDGHASNAPIDHADNNNRSLTWYWLQHVNRQVVTLAPTMLKLTSTGVYFTSRSPGHNSSRVSGKLIRNIRSDAPMMIGEFKHEDGEDYVMVVNLSLEKSAKFTIDTRNHYDEIKIVPSVKRHGELPPLKPDHWLVAGQGVLIKLGTVAPKSEDR